MLARVDSRATTGFDREIRRLRERVFEGGLGRDPMRMSLAMKAGSRRTAGSSPSGSGATVSRTTVRRSSLVRPVSAVMPAPWNVDQAVSLP